MGVDGLNPSFNWVRDDGLNPSFTTKSLLIFIFFLDLFVLFFFFWFFFYLKRSTDQQAKTLKGKSFFFRFDFFSYSFVSESK